MLSPDQKTKSRPTPAKRRRRWNWVLSDVIRVLLKFWIEWSARLKGQRFYCRVLAGEAEYNLTVNCDLTVSCNCQDYNGSGHLGNLRTHSFDEVYFGPVARRFRRELAEGRLPIKTCARCGDLARVPKSEVKSIPVEHGRANISRPPSTIPHPSSLSQPPSSNAGNSVNPSVAGQADTAGEPENEVFAGPRPRLPYRGMLLENTVRCNIDCLGCDRQSAARIRTSLQMDLANLSRMADLVHDLGMRQLFYLNLGEPFLSPNISEELPVLRRKNPDCRIVLSTNGIVLNTDAKRQAALSASHILFSIAGIDDAMLKKYEHLGSFDKAYNNFKAMVAYRNARALSQPLLEWKYLLFNWNDHRRSIERAIELAKAAGADFISFWPTSNPLYGYSFRYRLGLLNWVGVKCWKGREVDLRGTAQRI
jgi:pyruvate-formate lyase-activating enzyme